MFTISSDAAMKFGKAVNKRDLLKKDFKERNFPDIASTPSNSNSPATIKQQNSQ